MSAADMSNLEKLRVLLPHWIAHNKGHWEEFENYAQQLEKSGDQEVAQLLRLAVTGLREAQSHLEKGLEKLGGAAGDDDHSHGHHHHHHHH